MADSAMESLKQAVYEANMRLAAAKLAVLTWGNASGVNRERGVMAIKPSGVPYDALAAEDIVLVSLNSGERLPGEKLRPSSDTPTHICLYQHFPALGGIAHTHSRNATSWAQACREIPCYGTTHADTFHGSIPLCRALTAAEIDEGYEWNTGLVIAAHFEENSLEPLHIPGALLSFHAPFAWGETPDKAVENAIILEEVAALAMQTEMLNPAALRAPVSLIAKHFLRKHGENAYYGQSKPTSDG